MAKTYLTLADIKKMETAVTNLRDRLLIRVLFYLGCRITEALGLTVENIDLDQQLITIQHLKTRLHISCPACSTRLGRSHAFCPKCGGNVKEAVSKELAHRRVRTLPLDGETMKLLEQYINRGGPVRCGNWTLIFGINRHRAWQIVKECAEKAGLPRLVNPETGRAHNVSPHRLRDAFAVNAVKINDSGDGLRLLQEHLA